MLRSLVGWILGDEACYEIQCCFACKRATWHMLCTQRKRYSSVPGQSLL